MKNAKLAGVDRCSGFKGIDAPACRFTANEPHGGIVNEMIKAAHGIGTAAYTGNHCIRQPALLLQELRFGLPGDHRLEIPDNGRKRMRPHNGTKTVMGVIDPGCPFPHGLGDRILQRRRAAGHRHHLCPQQLHSVHIQRLPPGILLPHEYHTLHVHQGSSCSSCHTMLSGTGLGDEPGLSHLLCQQSLPQHIVDLVGAGMVQILPLQINLCATQSVGQLLCIVQPGGTVCILIQQLRQFPVECGVILVMQICLLQFYDSVHQGLRDVLSAVNAESSLFHKLNPFGQLLQRLSFFVHPSPRLFPARSLHPPQRDAACGSPVPPFPQSVPLQESRAL